MPASNQVPSSQIIEEKSPEPAGLEFMGRGLMMLRANYFGKSPAERAAAITETLERVILKHYYKEITTKELPEGTLLLLGDEPLILIAKVDLAPEYGGTMKNVVDRVTKELTDAKKEVAQSRSFKYLLRKAIYCFGATLVFILALFILQKVYKFLMGKFEALELRISNMIKIHEFGIFPQIVPITRGIFRIFNWMLILFGTNLWLTFCLVQFPQTRNLGENLGDYFIQILATLGDGFLSAIPDLFAIVIIYLLFRFLSQMINSFFKSVENGRVRLSWLHPEVVKPTSRIARTMLWVFAFIMAYPYLPGSDTEAFKGVGVLLGIILSIGSTSIANQAASGLALMYSRAFRAGDFIRFNDMEGVVQSLGVLSTKILTSSREELTIPNALLNNSTIRNYSRYDENSKGAIITTSITIGYSTPWRKIHELMLTAAKRTHGLAKKPEPVVRQRSLSDFYVEYGLRAICENPETRMAVLSDLHANIQDVFNESGEQIMSPHYESDPPEKVWVPKERWFEGTTKQHRQGTKPVIGDK